MTIYIFSGFYSTFVISAKSEKEAREMGEKEDIENPKLNKYHKLTKIYEEGEVFVEWFGE